jgi:O-methyltransferase
MIHTKIRHHNRNHYNRGKRCRMKLRQILQFAVNPKDFDIVRRSDSRRSRLSPGLRDPYSAYGVPELRSAISMVKDTGSTMLSERRMISLGQIVKYLELKGIPGSMIECGVWKGGAAAIMAAANVAYGARRRNIHLFDSFTDIVEPDPKIDGERAMYDVEQLTGRSRASITGALEPMVGIYGSHGGPGQPDAVKSLLCSVGYSESAIQLHVGFFQDTLCGFRQSEPIALLRIDADWYQSTKICLESLADHVSPGGIIIIDDYGAYDGCATAVNEFLARRSPTLINWVDSECVYFTLES